MIWESLYPILGSIRPHGLEALARTEAGETLAEIGRSYNVSHSTISRLPPEVGGSQ